MKVITILLIILIAIGTMGMAPKLKTEKIYMYEVRCSSCNKMIALEECADLHMHRQISHSICETCYVLLYGTTEFFSMKSFSEIYDRRENFNHLKSIGTYDQYYHSLNGSV